jgi:hypothetical protein
MRGTMLTYKPGSPHPIVHRLTAPPELQLLQAAVGDGYIEHVPYFETINWEGEDHICVALCNEDGKRLQLAMNHTATDLWDRSLQRNRKVASASPDYLVGSVVVLFGDPEFMEAL